MAGTGSVTATSIATGVSGRPLWPSDVSGLVLWLPADQIQGIASGASLSAWTDSSASASHATQPSVASQPVFLTNVQNGLSAVSFGVTAAQIMVSQTSLLATSTIAMTLASALGANAGRRPICGTASSDLRLGVNIGAGNTSQVAKDAGLAGGVTPQNTWLSMIAIANASATTLAVSGATVSGDIGSGATSSTQLILGAQAGSALTFAGWIGETIVYNRNLKEIERSSIESYLRTKWGI
jgi:hypothetical protein